MKNTKEIKQKKCSEKGITLVTLIITVLLLTIIASITVSTSWSRFKINKVKMMFNDIEMFIVALFDTFLKKKDIYFFNDLKEIFNSYSTDDKETCMFIINDLMRILDRYKMSKEIECIKHIVNEKNVVDFVSNLFTCFEMRISEDKDGEFFGKDFGKDINGFNRNND